MEKILYYSNRRRSCLVKWPNHDFFHKDMQKIKYMYLSNISYLYCKMQIHKTLEFKNNVQYFIESSNVV